MPKLFVKTKNSNFSENSNSNFSVNFISDKSILETLNRGKIYINSGCGGNGRCGLCKIEIKDQAAKVRAEIVNTPTKGEKRLLAEDEISQGIRLACHTIAYDDLNISMLNSAVTASWRDIKPEEYMNVSSQTDISPCSSYNISPTSSVLPKCRDKIFGAAVDLGTTHIRVTLWDMQKRVRLSGRFGVNPQISFGSDVLTRIAAAAESEDILSTILELSQNTIRDEIRNMAVKLELNYSDIRHIVIVGNSSMLALLSGKNYKELLMPQNWIKDIDISPDDPLQLSRSWGFSDNTCIELIEPIGGFVGSDIIAGSLAARLVESDIPSLLIDFGTNSEIALWDGITLWITSAAGGPAFEKVGIYGSDIVDIIAELLKNSIIKPNGRFTDKACGNNASFTVQPNSSAAGHQIGDISITKRDIDMFQRAKAAVAAGVISVIKRAGVSVKDLKRVCICGVFGNKLNVENAQYLGLLPQQIEADKVELCGNTALAGCEIMLFNPDRAASVKQIKTRTKIINLSESSDFENLFIQNLQLLPIRAD
ncbi:MAG: ASKHA domain-containing protein [Desulfamplus sp.]